MSDTHEPHSQPEEPAGSGWSNPGWTPPPPPPEWPGNSWSDPNSWAQGQYGGQSGQSGQGGPGQGGHGQSGGGSGQSDAPPPGSQQPYGPYGYGPYGQDPRAHWTPPPPPPPWGGNPYSGAGSGWNYGWGTPSRPRRSLPSAVTALLLVVAVLVGLGIGHGVWRSAHNAAASGGSSQLPGGTGGGGTGGSGTGGGGSGGSGSSNGGFNPFGNGSFGNGSSNGFASPGSSGPLTGAAAAVANDLVDIDTTLSYEDDEAAGTGIVLASDGYVLTNNHVISGATSIKATDIGNGQTYTATVVGYDRTHDVAVIKLNDASGLKTAKFADSSKVSVGEDVTGLGNAGGVGGTPSSASGQITALNQSITAEDQGNGTSEKLSGLIETNCNIQEGDSGGPLINSSGQVVGMDTAASTGFSIQTTGNQGFSIPINQAISIASTIRSGQTTSTVHIGQTAFLGVEIDTSASSTGNGGATISTEGNGVLPNSPAAQAGLAPGDVITSLGGAAVTSASSLTNLMTNYHPGDKVSLGWTDTTGQGHQTTVTLASGPPQ